MNYAARRAAAAAASVQDAELERPGRGVEHLPRVDVLAAVRARERPARALGAAWRCLLLVVGLILLSLRAHRFRVSAAEGGRQLSPRRLRRLRSGGVSSAGGADMAPRGLFRLSNTARTVTPGEAVSWRPSRRVFCGT